MHLLAGICEYITLRRGLPCTKKSSALLLSGHDENMISLSYVQTDARKNFRHCAANSVGSCCVRVGSGLQTDATTSNNVGAFSASWGGYNP